MAVVERSVGRLPAAERLLRNAIIEARARIGANSYAEALAGTLLAELAYETNASGEALTLVENLDRRSKARRSSWIPWPACLPMPACCS